MHALSLFPRDSISVTHILLRSSAQVVDLSFSLRFLDPSSPVSLVVPKTRDGEIVPRKGI